MILAERRSQYCGSGGGAHAIILSCHRPNWHPVTVTMPLQNTSDAQHHRLRQYQWPAIWAFPAGGNTGLDLESATIMSVASGPSGARPKREVRKYDQAAEPCDLCVARARWGGCIRHDRAEPG